ncbi:MAG: hypothetical protein QOF48_17 [Verrucomicrobiota bacterium]
MMEEAFHLVRVAPARALVAYCVGSLPFVLGLLYFWSDMARSAFAAERLQTSALGMTLLFFWMKMWHGVYAQTLLAHLCGDPSPRWTVRWLWRIAVYQAIVQPLGIILLPLSLPLIIPFGWSYAFFNNATVLAGSAVPDVKSLVNRSIRQAFQWPLQTQFAIFAFKLLGAFVFLNLLVALFAFPYLGRTLLGIESVITRNPWAAVNSTALTGIVALSWLCLDPVVKALFTLRCFYGESLKTGQDLRAGLKAFAGPSRLASAAAVVLILLVSVPAFVARAADPTPGGIAGSKSTPDSRKLDEAIERVIEKREYSWRLPRDKAVHEKKDGQNEGWVERFFKGIERGTEKVSRALRDFMDWVTKKSGGPTTSPLGNFDLAAAIMPLLVLLLVALAGVLAWLIVKVWRRPTQTEVAVTELPATLPDVADENVGADQLPEEGWLSAARELLQRGEARLALRAFYLASLAILADRNLIALARFKSNHDYERELRRRGHALPEMPQVFAENVSVFERVWYGAHAVTPAMLDQFAANVQRIKNVA